MAIAFFRHRQRDNLHTVLRHGFDERGGIFRRDMQGFQSADNLIIRVVGIAHGDGIKPVLRGQGIARIGGTQTGPHNTPAMIARIERLFGISGLMGTMKRSQAQMHKACLDIGAIIGGTHNL